ncbi:hypothetical protein EV663_102225 [Rhodovulum bhavnagarense]|uniref:Glutathione S-transferase n=1 Tax=Rhodovulum bhavnagarense TaxID=992286 RepID=A0A4R2RI64_9RHOB|nr:MAPEG family protein [Rhodovulum bhavnagarense]TCP62378.1 hypothetical protein EV663_102225 [Rhodovulum bhavnagarense]
MASVTALYAGLIALLYLYLSLRVIQRRGSTRIFIGDGGDVELSRRIRVHANLNEYAPLALVLLLLAELQGAPVWALHLLGAMLLLGRLGHAWGMSRTPQSPIGRGGGTALSWAMIGLTAAGLVGHAAL